MPVPTNLSDLDVVAANNYPAATETLSTADDYFRAHASILKKISTGANALTTPALGTATSGTLTNCTGLPISTGVSGLGTGVATFLATPSSANLASAVTDETGSGALVFATTPTLTSVKETRTAPTISGGSLTLDLAGSSVFDVSLNAAITSITISNPAASGTAHGFVLTFTADGTARAVTWPAAVKWPSGTAPTLTSTNNKKDAFVFMTTDGGTSYHGFVAGQNL